jgi:hypothetical protein
MKPVWSLVLLNVAVGLAAIVEPNRLPRAQQPEDTAAAPAGATARCRDGTYSFSQHRSGTCSHHGGVATWLDSARMPPPATGDALSPAPGGEARICGSHCGTERWDVKTLSDADRELVRFQPVDATVESLTSLAPAGIAPGGARYTPTELTVYRVEAYLGGAFPENDGDWHLVLYGMRNQRVSLIAEIPDPSCAGACRSGFSQQFARARQMLQAVLQRPNPTGAAILVRVTGIGFFDRPHGQIGAAPNNFELHPVLTIEFPK